MTQEGDTMFKIVLIGTGFSLASRRLQRGEVEHSEPIYEEAVQLRELADDRGRVRHAIDH